MHFYGKVGVQILNLPPNAILMTCKAHRGRGNGGGMKRHGRPSVVSYLVISFVNGKEVACIVYIYIY